MTTELKQAIERLRKDVKEIAGNVTEAGHNEDILTVCVAAEKAMRLQEAIADYRKWFDTCTKTNVIGWEALACNASEQLDAALSAMEDKMNDPIKPSESELKAGEMAAYAESDLDRAIIIATHTRFEGKTAQEWGELWAKWAIDHAHLKQRAKSVEADKLLLTGQLKASRELLAKSEAKVRELEHTIADMHKGAVQMELQRADQIGKQLKRIAELEAGQRKAQAEALRWVADRICSPVASLTRPLLEDYANQIERGDVTVGGRG